VLRIRCRRGGIDWDVFARDTVVDATGTHSLLFVWCATLESSKVRTQDMQQCYAVMYLQLLLAAVGASHGHSFPVSCFGGRGHVRSNNGIISSKPHTVGFYTSKVSK